MFGCISSTKDLQGFSLFETTAWHKVYVRIGNHSLLCFCLPAAISVQGSRQSSLPPTGKKEPSHGLRVFSKRRYLGLVVELDVLFPLDCLMEILFRNRNPRSFNHGICSQETESIRLASIIVWLHYSSAVSSMVATYSLSYANAVGMMRAR